MRSIPLHREYGLNPTLSTCFYCGKETGEIALLGANYKGEAPMHMCTSIEPCDECKEKYKDFVLLVEVVDERTPQPTGRWMAIKKECVSVPNKDICYITPETFALLAKQVGGNNG